MTGRLGATPHKDGSCTFRTWAPLASRVTVTFPQLDRREALDPSGDGYHVARVPDIAPGARYAYLLDDDPLELPDPASASQPDGVHAASAVVDHAAFGWTDAGWFGRPLREYVIYELHVGTFTPEGTFDAVIDRLDELAADGITAIELLPVAEFPGHRNWGYDGVDLFAPHSAYGGPEGLCRLVDAAHARRIAVVLDVVYNHLGPEGNYLSRFGPYFSDRHHTPWGAAVNVDGPGSDEVRRFFIDNALQWTRDYHVDALRLDAIHGIVDTSAHPFLLELTEAVEEQAEADNRRAHVIAESDLNDVRVITPSESGGLGFHTQWTDDFHHALHVALTGESTGYYADFQGGLVDLATSLRRGFVYTGQRSAHRERRFGSDSSGMPGERFVVYAQNHDQVGNRLLGDRLAATLDADQQRLALAAVLLSPFVPMLFMGEEYGEQRPFPYFVSHTDEQLVAAVREGRRREFASFGFTGEAPDPQGEETFRSAVLDWEARGRDGHRQRLELTRELLRLRRTLPSLARLRPAQATVEHEPGSGLLTIERGAGDETTLLALNFGDRPVQVGSLRAAGPLGSRLLDTEDPRYGGAGVDHDMIAPRSAALLGRAAEQMEESR